MKLKKFVAIAALVSVTAGCAGMSQTEQRTLSGGAIGAAGGALITGIAGGSGVS